MKFPGISNNKFPGYGNKPESDPTIPAWAKQENKPTYTASEVHALADTTKYGHSIDLSLDTNDYKLTVSLKDQDGTVLNSKVVDFPIESVVVNGSYDSTNKKIVLTLQNGNTIDVPVGDLVAGLQTEITSVNMLDADLVDDTNSTHKFVTTSEKNTWNGKQDALPFNSAPSSSNKVATMADVYTKQEVDIKFLDGDTNGHEYVDLGLPSGTLWATMNVGAVSDTDYGDYYMYGKGSQQYNSSDAIYTGTENPLDFSVDTARQVWGGNWCMPTKAQCDELFANTVEQRADNYKGSGINGYTFTGRNGNVLFLPAAGVKSESGIAYLGTSVNTWCSTPRDSDNAYHLYCGAGDNGAYSISRNRGYVIRPVISLNEKYATKQELQGKEDVTTIVAPVNATDATLPITTLTTEVGKYYRLDVPVETLDVTLPAMTNLTTVRTVVIYLTGGTTPAVTISAADNKHICYQYDYKIEEGKTYEINALFNGAAWIVAAVDIDVKRYGNDD